MGGASPSILSISDHPTVLCKDGSLEVEATLFAATLGVKITTTVGEARTRLARSGLTAAMASQALLAINPEALASYARADCVRAVLPKLGPCEVFAGESYDPQALTYDGLWFDLRALAADLHVSSGGLVLQGLYLVSLLDELAPDTPLTLENGGGGKAARVAFLKPRSVTSALGKLVPRAPATRRDGDDDPRVPLGRSLRDRSSASTPSARARQRGLEQALDRPARGRLAPIELWTIERQLEANDVRGALERIQSYVRSHGGESAATRYLRAYLALLDGSEPPRHIAEDLLEEGRSGAPFPELDLLKARAWAAAGAWTYARHFARAVVDDPNVSDAMSLLAHEIMETAKARGAGSGPPSPRTPASEDAPVSTERIPRDVDAAPAFAGNGPVSSRREGASVQGTPIYVLGAELIDPVPSSVDVPVDFEEPISDPWPRGDALSSQAAPTQQPHVVNPPGASGHHYDRGHMTDRPPPTQRTIDVVASPPARYEPEEIETLSLPGGLSDEHLAEGVVARSGNEVRIVSTRFARLLGREYREKYGVRLRADAQAVDWMQRHLVTRWGNSGLTNPEAVWDVRRHGALLSEILARTLGADWVDVSPSEIGYWAMFVPPRTRTWPFGRVHRFLTLGHREKDLVSYYLDLVARARNG
jgi:hypothetical protein